MKRVYTGLEAAEYVHEEIENLDNMKFGKLLSMVSGHLVQVEHTGEWPDETAKFRLGKKLLPGEKFGRVEEI